MCISLKRVSDHSLTQTEEFVIRQVVLGVICAPGANSEVGWTQTIPNVIDSREKSELCLVCTPLLLRRLVIVLADKSPIEFLSCIRIFTL